MIFYSNYSIETEEKMEREGRWDEEENKALTSK